MRNFMPILLCVAFTIGLPAVASAHGSNVFESADQAKHDADHGHAHVATAAGHAPSDAEEFEEIHEQIEQLQARLTAHDERIRIADIVGGLGYIVGITGIAYYYLGARRMYSSRSA